MSSFPSGIGRARGGAALALGLLVLTACATDGAETRKACNHHCSVMYETCFERTHGGNTVNNCGYEDVRCNAMCPSH